MNFKFRKSTKMPLIQQLPDTCIRIHDAKHPMTGCITGRRWSAIAEAMVKSGEIVLRANEQITGIQIASDYGLYFQLGEKKP